MLVACGCAGIARAQTNAPAVPGGLANFKLVEPGPELPGDRAMSCMQIAREMGEIMNRRNVKDAVAASKDKLCRAKREIEKPGVDGLGQQRVTANVNSGVADMLGVMNDPRLMRLNVLAMNQSCAEKMAPPEKSPPATGDGCDEAAGPPKAPNSKNLAGKPPLSPVPDVSLPAMPADPFVKKGAGTPQPGASDPFAKR